MFRKGGLYAYAEEGGNSIESVASLVKTMQLMRAEFRIGNQELKADLNGLREEVRTGFDQIYRHIDGFILSSRLVFVT